MTPNQITAVAATVRNLLDDGHAQGLTGGNTTISDDGAVATVHTYWTEPEDGAIGSLVRMSATVADDGTVIPLDAWWQKPAPPAIPIPPAVTDCVVCDGAGCEWCPRVGGLA